jgi:hypothetical protein
VTASDERAAPGGILRAVLFGPWHPLESAGPIAPDTPGVMQARGDGLLPFPRGKSAMILYAASREGESLAAFVIRAQGQLAQAAALGARHVRFAPAAQPGPALQRLLERFVDRFGALPPANLSPNVFS